LINVAVYTHPTTVRVRVSRWLPGSRYPEPVLQLALPNVPGGRGRDNLRRALNAVVDSLEALEAPEED